jgi:hypothetical protein
VSGKEQENLNENLVYEANLKLLKVTGIKGPIRKI